jgi:hypothetical protein
METRRNWALGAFDLLAPFVTLFPGYIPNYHPGIHYKIK